MCRTRLRIRGRQAIWGDNLGRLNAAIVRRGGHSGGTAAGGSALLGLLLLLGLRGLLAQLGHAGDGRHGLDEGRESRCHLVVVCPGVFWEVGEGFSRGEEEDVRIWVVGEEI